MLFVEILERQEYNSVSSGLTQRAADGGYAPRFQAFFWLWVFLRFDGESTLPPTAANASRWLAPYINYES